MVLRCAAPCITWRMVVWNFCNLLVKIGEIISKMVTNMEV